MPPDPALKIAVRTLARRLVRRQILKDAKAFEALTDSLKNAYTRSWNSQHQAAVADSLDRLRDMSDTQIASFGPAQTDKIMRTLEGKVGGQAMQAALNGPVVKLTEPLHALGFKELADAGVDIVFGLPDTDALNVVAKSNLFWVGEHWNAFTHDKFEQALNTYFGQGLTRVQLAERMMNDFASMGERGAAYWNLLADHTATKTRELGRADAYIRAGVKYVQVRAHIDHRTTEICKALNGKIISVERIAKQKNDYLDAVDHMNSQAAKNAWPMMNDQDAEKIVSGKMPENVGSPPYHFRCRTITVVYFEG